jgi:hypothetical protein
MGIDRVWGRQDDQNTPAERPRQEENGSASIAAWHTARDCVVPRQGGMTATGAACAMLGLAEVGLPP